MRIEIVVPIEGGGQDVLLNHWCKQIGETLKMGDAICEIESEKSVLDVTAPCEGVLTDWLYASGDAVPVGAALAVMESEKAVLAPPLAHAPQSMPEQAGSPQMPKPAATAAPEEVPRARLSIGKRGVLATPKARRLAAEQGLSLGDYAIRHRPIFARDIERAPRVSFALTRQFDTDAANQLALRTGVTRADVMLYIMARAFQRIYGESKILLGVICETGIRYKKMPDALTLRQVPMIREGDFTDRAAGDVVIMWTGKDRLEAKLDCPLICAGVQKGNALEIRVQGKADGAVHLLDEIERFADEPVLLLAM